jgi:hypothetical protein
MSRKRARWLVAVLVVLGIAVPSFWWFCLRPPYGISIPDWIFRTRNDKSTADSSFRVRGRETVAHHREKMLVMVMA